MTHASLAVAAAALLWACLVIYTVTGLADYGGGIWDLLARGDAGQDQRDLIAKVLAPIWEVNHIWLIAAVVLAFTCFPEYFAWYSETLHTPLAIMLLGLVCRGVAFTFRAYGPERQQDTWGRLFGIASVLTPAGLGLCLGTILAEDAAWAAPFPAAVAILVVLHGSVLAAAYLVGEAHTPAVRDAFRRRCFGAAIMTAGAGLATLGLASVYAPRFFAQLTAGWEAILLHQVTAGTGVGLLAATRTGRDRWLRPLVVTQSLALVGGVALAQYPFLRYPEFSIVATASPATTLRWTLGIFAGGSVLLVPALATLFWVFRAAARVPEGDEG